MHLQLIKILLQHKHLHVKLGKLSRYQNEKIFNFTFNGAYLAFKSTLVLLA